MISPYWAKVCNFGGSENPHRDSENVQTSQRKNRWLMNSNTASSFWTFIPNLYFIFLYFCAYLQYIAKIPCYMLSRTQLFYIFQSFTYCLIKQHNYFETIWERLDSSVLGILTHFYSCCSLAQQQHFHNRKDWCSSYLQESKNVSRDTCWFSDSVFYSQITKQRQKGKKS